MKPFRPSKAEPPRAALAAELADQIRCWVNRYEHGPTLAIAVCTIIPIIAAMVVLTGAPWWYLPASIAIIAVPAGWTAIVIAAFSKWTRR